MMNFLTESICIEHQAFVILAGLQDLFQRAVVPSK